MVQVAVNGHWEALHDPHLLGQYALEGGAEGFKDGAIVGGILGGLTSEACFIEGTPVATQIGLAAIETITVGMMVWARNAETGETALKKVVRTFVHETNELVHIHVNGEIITCTPEHPFYVDGKGWVGAIRLRAGDRLVLVNGQLCIIEQVQHEILEAPVKVYNFEVQDFHTYFVGREPVLVHNVCTQSGKSASDYDAGAKPVRIDGEWSEDDFKMALKGKPPKGLGSPQLHHGGQMPGGALHEIIQEDHLHMGLHPNKYNQGVTAAMRNSGRKLHWWYRAREMGADLLYPEWIYGPIIF